MARSQLASVGFSCRLPWLLAVVARGSAHSSVVIRAIFVIAHVLSFSSDEKSSKAIKNERTEVFDFLPYLVMCMST